jgi:hypothetical protein
VTLEQLVTKVCVGDTINVRGSGYVYDYKGKRVVRSRFAVWYQLPGKAASRRILSEDRSLADVIDREFTEEREFTFDNPGTYTFKFWVYLGAAPTGLAISRVVEVVDGCQVSE